MKTTVGRLIESLDGAIAAGPEGFARNDAKRKLGQLARVCLANNFNGLPADVQTLRPPRREPSKDFGKRSPERKDVKAEEKVVDKNKEV